MMNSAKRLISPIKLQNEVLTKKAKLSNGNVSPCIQVKPEKETLENYDFLFDDGDDNFNFSALDAAEAAVPEPKFERVKLNLNEWTRCIVEEVERERRSYDLVLQVRAESYQDKQNSCVVSKCHLQGAWSTVRVDVGCVVSLLAAWDTELGAFKVNQDYGFCVTDPDTLISGTSVVGSLFCRRKAVLQDRFKGIDANNKVMVIGSMVHELLQIVLAKGLKTYKQIDAVAQELLHSKVTAYTLYASLLTREETSMEVEKFIPNIVSFVDQYVERREPVAMHKDNFQGQIIQIQDIEENVWVPQLGLKGKVDVSVRIRRRNTPLQYDTSNKNAIPLELKTGRASFSSEHKGQVILYQMMLSAIGREARSGLLLYLREGIMREIRGARNEQRDLTILRNDLAHYLSHAPSIPSAETPLAVGAGKYVQPIALPEPISHHSACHSCAYASLCCTFAKTDESLHLRDGHPLQAVMQQTTANLKAEDYEYFIYWCGMLALEEQEARKTNYLKSLWTDTPELRQQHGRAIIDLELCDEAGVVFEESRYLHTFKLNKQQEASHEFDLTLCGFSMGEYVIVSSRKRLAIAAGCVYDLNKSTISISLERNLKTNYALHAFILDKHESQSGNVFNFTNLGLLLDGGNEKAAALRAIVVHREQPAFDIVLPKLNNEAVRIFNELNSVQGAAVRKALTTQSFMLIKGLPGTGKTQTLVALVRLLHIIGKSVLITSHTHSAVDNLLVRLKAHALPLLRLGSGARINPQLVEFSESEIMKECRSEEDLSRKYASYRIVGVTCLGSSHALFLHRKFDYCIVDEATQVMQPTVLRPLLFCDKFILVGDPDQLPPLIRAREARQRGADESLFHRLDSVEATSMLTLQYRMNKTITRLANELTYAGALQCASQEIQLATMKLQLPTAANKEKWLQRALQSHIDQAVFLLDTTDCSERSFAFASAKHSKICTAIEETFSEDIVVSTPALELSKQKSSSNRLSKYTNYCDAAVIFHMVKMLLSVGYQPERIGIIAPYRAQVELLRKLAAQHYSFYQSETPVLNFSAVEVNTIDQYQGRDKDIIFYSCAKTGAVNTDSSERLHEAEILEDKRRLTVAITRSKYKLVLVGDAVCLQQYSPFRSLLAHIPGYCKLKLEDGKQGFDWQIIMDELSEVISD